MCFCVYFLRCSDLEVKVVEKIGSCKNWINRKGGYITCMPYNGPTLNYLIVCDNEKEMIEIEVLLHHYYKEFNTKNNKKHNGGGTEWFEFEQLPTVDKLKNILSEYGFDKEIIFGDALDKYVNEMKRTIREYQQAEETENEKIQESLELVKKAKNNIFMKFPQELRGYQTETNDKLDIYYKTNDKGILNWTCGLGKTMMALYRMRTYKKVLIGVPSLLLLSQWVTCIKKCFPNLQILLIASASKMNDVTLTTDKEYVNKWIESKNAFVILTTYHSSHVVKHLKFDFKILDECHHVCQTHYDSKFYKILQIESKKQLALTATLKAIEDDSKIDNYNKESFGDIVDIKSTLWAIDNKYITDYEVITVRVEETTLCTIMTDVLENITHQELFLAAFVILESMVQYPGLTHVLAYTNKIVSANILKDYIDVLLKKRFKSLYTEFYNDALDTDSLKSTKLDKEVKSFEKYQRGVISSVYIFGEGVDIPKVNCICVAENMGSEIRIVQSVMRGNRLEPGNPEKINRIILPYIDNEQNTFEKVETVITKMGNQDANIEQRIHACVIGFSGKNTKEQYEVDFDNVKELDHVKLKLRHRSALRSPGSRVNAEYKYLQSLNILRGVMSKSEYYVKIKVERLDNPRQYFDTKDPTVWRSWYDFLGVDINMFPSTKDKWRNVCETNSVTSSDYSKRWKQYNLPEYPEDLYRDFNNISSELGENKNRRR